MEAWLVYFGKSTGSTEGNQLVLPGLQPGDVVPLTLTHPERWRRQDVTRVIVGSEPTWADVVLVDDPLTIQREHVRFYLNHRAPAKSDFRAMKNCPVTINGQPYPPFEWVNVQHGDEIVISYWRFRYEWRETT